MPLMFISKLLSKAGSSDIGFLLFQKGCGNVVAAEVKAIVLKHLKELDPDLHLCPRRRYWPWRR